MMFGGSDDDGDEDNAAAKELGAKVDRLTDAVESMQDRMDTMSDRFKSLDEKIENIDYRESYDIDRVKELMDQHTEKVSEQVRSMKSLVSALHEKYRGLQERIEEDYRPELERESKILDRLLEAIHDVQDRLGTYGRLQQSVNTVEEHMEELKTDLTGKIGRSEFEEIRDRTREEIKRLKSRLEMLD